MYFIYCHAFTKRSQNDDFSLHQRNIGTHADRCSIRKLTNFFNSYYTYTVYVKIRAQY